MTQSTKVVTKDSFDLDQGISQSTVYLVYPYLVHIYYLDGHIFMLSTQILLPRKVYSWAALTR